MATLKVAQPNPRQEQGKGGGKNNDWQQRDKPNFIPPNPQHNNQGKHQNNGGQPNNNNNRPRQAGKVNRFYQRCGVLKISTSDGEDEYYYVPLQEFYDENGSLVDPNSPLAAKVEPIGYIFAEGNWQWKAAKDDPESAPVYLDIVEKINRFYKDMDMLLTAAYQWADHTNGKKRTRQPRGGVQVVQPMTFSSAMRWAVAAALIFTFIVVLITANGGA